VTHDILLQQFVQDAMEGKLGRTGGSKKKGFLS